MGNFLFTCGNMINADEEAEIKAMLELAQKMRKQDCKKYCSIFCEKYDGTTYHKVAFHPKFNEFLDIVDFPPNTIYVVLGHNFNRPLDHLPHTLIHLYFHVESYFNKSVDNLPSTLTYLTFGKYFNHSVDNLPLSLSHLSLGERFNQRIDKLPDYITHLSIGAEFNQSIDNLPEYLTHLSFGTLMNYNNETIFTEKNIPIEKDLMGTNVTYRKNIPKISIDKIINMDRKIMHVFIPLNGSSYAIREKVANMNLNGWRIIILEINTKYKLKKLKVDTPTIFIW